MYLIAYKEKDGNDFIGQPYILGDFNNFYECKENAQHLVRDWYCYVMVFECEDTAPEEISWDYVKSNQVDS